MNWKRVVGYGALLWVLMFAIMSALIGFGIYRGPIMETIGAFIGGGIAWYLAGRLEMKRVSDVVLVALVWIGVSLALDSLVTVRFAPDIFKDWALWLGYGLAVAAVIVRFSVRKK